MGTIKRHSFVAAAGFGNVPQEIIAHCLIQKVIHIFSKPLVSIRTYDFQYVFNI